MEIRELEKDELEDALKLVWEVFSEYEAPEYSEEGINEFWRFIHNSSEIDKLCIYAAFNENEIVGVLAMREEHISLFFVNQEYHRRGIGKSLFKYMMDRLEADELTVNSSPYAVEIYKKLGFSPSDEERVDNGIRYTPMLYKLN